MTALFLYVLLHVLPVGPQPVRNQPINHLPVTIQPVGPRRAPGGSIQ